MEDFVFIGILIIEIEMKVVKENIIYWLKSFSHIKDAIEPIFAKIVPKSIREIPRSNPM